MRDPKTFLIQLPEHPHCPAGCCQMIAVNGLILPTPFPDQRGAKEALASAIKGLGMDPVIALHALGLVLRPQDFPIIGEERQTTKAHFLGIESSYRVLAETEEELVLSPSPEIDVFVPVAPRELIRMAPIGRETIAQA